MINFPPLGSPVQEMPWHVVVGNRRYQSLEGAELSRVGARRLRVASLERAVRQLAATLRAYGFRPFRPMTSESPDFGRVESEVTGVREARIRRRMPWQPRLVYALVSFEIVGGSLIQRPVNGTGPPNPTALYDVTATLSVGLAVFRRGRWEPVSRGSFHELAPGVADRLLWDIRRVEAP